MTKAKIKKAKGWCIMVENNEFHPTIFATKKDAIQESEGIKSMDIVVKVVRCELKFNW